MTQLFSFARTELALTHAASEGARDAASLLAQSLGASGTPALVQAAAAGAAVVVHGAGARNAVQAMRPAVAAAISRRIGEALKAR